MIEADGIAWVIASALLGLFFALEWINTRRDRPLRVVVVIGWVIMGGLYAYEYLAGHDPLFYRVTASYLLTTAFTLGIFYAGVLLGRIRQMLAG